MTLMRLQTPATLREAATDELRRAIVSGRLAPGALLKDTELAIQLGLSATPVREALMQLVAEGLVAIEPNKSRHVAAIDIGATVQLLQVQEALWSLGYSWGIPKIDAAAVAALRSINAALEAALAAGDLLSAVSAALSFHRAVMEASGNLELVRVSTDRLALIQRFVLLAAPWITSTKGLNDHKAIVAAIERGDHAGAIAIFKASNAELLRAAITLRDAQIKEKK
ncbi:MAG: GntR family transcriptional regulator [Verrucomicrobiaceae bacterium]|nr:GntR family transcriptional regulator [Verrucomicrobiaceae bacterium]